MEETMMLRIARTLILAVAGPLVALAALSCTAQAQNIGSTQQDLPVSEGQFEITNNTGFPVHYLIRWGDRGFWDEVVLQPGWTELHSHGLDANGRAPTPHVSFRRAGPSGFETRTYAMAFSGVSSGQTGVQGAPKPYAFARPGGGDLDLFTVPD
jgi:hypothetical protein